MASQPPAQSPRLRRLSSANAPTSPLSRRTSMFPSPTTTTTSTSETQMPVRHPQPLTAAELHHELEKEQEAVVNRLQRELSQLRSQAASAASNSSASTTTSAVFDTTSGSGAAELTTPSSFYLPTSARRHRSSSSYSTRSLSISSPAHPLERSSQASVDRARDAGVIAPSSVGGSGGGRSRQNSSSVTLAPPPPRATLSRQASDRLSPGSVVLGQGQGGQYFGAAGGSGSNEEAQAAKAALDVARRENERLVARVRELERRLREKESGFA